MCNRCTTLSDPAIESSVADPATCTSVQNWALVHREPTKCFERISLSDAWRRALRAHTISTVRNLSELRTSRTAVPDGTTHPEVVLSTLPPRSRLKTGRTRSRIRCGSFALIGLALAAGVSAPVSAETTETPPFIVPSSTAAPTTAAPVASPPTTQAPAPVATEQPAATPTTVASTETTPTAEATPTTLAPTPTTLAPKTTRKPQAATSAGELANPRATGGVSIEVSIARQVMTIRKGVSVWKTINVSTGSGRRYCEKGKCGVAVTPRGRYRIYSRVSGWKTAALGKLYNPLYFTGGYAIHGSGSVPRYPASHGCVRVSVANARWLPSAIPNGTPVHIY